MRDAVLVTGASGYIGRWVVRRLVSLQIPVVAVARSRWPDEWRNTSLVEWIQADALGGSPELSAALSRSRALIHLAWEDGFVLNSRRHPESLSAHYRFLVGALDAGVPRVASAGTMHEVGYWEGAVTADTPTAPVSLYGITKDALRRLLFAGLGDRPEALLWLRFFYIYGDDRRNQSIFTKLLQAEEEGRAEFPFTSGANRYDFIHVEELARQIVAVVLSSTPSGIVNCSSGRAEPLGERVEAFIRDNGLRLRLKYGAFPDRPSDSPAIWGDASVVQAILAGTA